ADHAGLEFVDRVVVRLGDRVQRDRIGDAHGRADHRRARDVRASERAVVLAYAEHDGAAAQPHRAHAVAPRRLGAATDAPAAPAVVPQAVDAAAPARPD